MTISTTFPGSVSCPTSTMSNAMTLGTTKTFVVTMTNASGGNKYYIDGYLQPVLELHQGQTYIFDLSSSTLSGHPFVFDSSNSNDGTTNSDPYYTTGITSTGTYASNQTRTFIVPAGAPTTLYYYCTAHSGMGASASISPTAKLIVSGRVDSTDLVVTGTEGMTISVGTTAQRPSNPTTGMIRYNSTIGSMESYLGTGWAPIAQQPTVTGVSPITTLTSGGSTTGWDTGTKITASNGLAGEQFGWSVSMSADGTKVIAGARNEAPQNYGAVYIFTYSGGSWSQEKLVAPNRSTNDYFGYSVSISGDGTKVIVGAPSEDSTANQSSSTGAGDSGAAYIFTYSSGSWDTGTMIKAEDAQGSDDFGQGVSMNSDGTKVLVGAQREDTGASDSGAAYIFAYSGGSWSQQAKIFPDVAKASGKFGSEGLQLSPDGTKAIVGAYYSDNSSGSSAAGAAYVFTYDGSSWSQQALITPSDGDHHDYFGRSVSMNSNGTKIIVGADSNETAGSNSGKVYIYTYSGGSWGSEVMLQSDDIQASDHFGYRVSMSSDGTKVLVGARYEDPNNISNAGSAYVFTYNGTSWVQEQKIVASDPEATDMFGYHVAMSGNGLKAIVGAYGEDTGGSSAGAAYIFDLNSVTDSGFVFDSLTQVFTATGTGIIPGSTLQLEGADGTLYSVFDTTTPNAAGTQVTFKMGEPILSQDEAQAINSSVNRFSLAFDGDLRWKLYDMAINYMGAVSSGGLPTPTGVRLPTSAEVTDASGAYGRWYYYDGSTYTDIGRKSGPASGFFTVANQPYKIRVNAKSGLVATSTATIGFAVGWTTAAGANLDFDTSASTTNTLAGTDGGGGTNRTFSVAPSSTALPAGLTLTGSTGAITGTIGALGTTSVTFRLTDTGSGLFTDRAINIVGSAELYTFSSHTFTNCLATGRYGPTFTQMKAAYASEIWEQNTAWFNEISGKQGFQLWTVPATGTYTIKAYGASAGMQTTDANKATGWGAWTQGDFSLTKGEKLCIIVGQNDTTGGTSGANAAGGGGASWVLKEDYGGSAATAASLYLVAGGGGGVSPYWNQPLLPSPGAHAPAAQASLVTSWVGAASGQWNSGGGASYGIDGIGAGTPGQSKGLRPYAGANGGNHAYNDTSYNNVGGFGGGGGSGAHAGGGGGGYVGGSASTSYNARPGHGGSSRNNGTNTTYGQYTTALTGTTMGRTQGKVIITQN